MNSYINRSALKKTQYKSAGVSILSYTAHQLNEAGIYLGKIYHGKRIVDEFKIVCSPDCGDQQLNIDMATFDLHGRVNKGGKKYEVSTEGYVLLYDSKSNNDLQVCIEKASEKKAKPHFDTCVLNKGDVFAVTILRPGKYHGLNLQNKTELELTVQYPEENQRKKDERIINPVSIEVRENGFYPKAAKIAPGQGVVFNISTPANLEMSLKEAYEKPTKAKKEVKKDNNSRSQKIRKRFHWENPRRKNKSQADSK